MRETPVISCQIHNDQNFELIIRLKQKQAELQAVQARNRAKQILEVDTASPEELVKLETGHELKEEPETEKITTESSVSLRSRWNKLALAMLS